MNFWYEIEDLETGIYQIQGVIENTGDIVHIKQNGSVEFLGSSGEELSLIEYKDTFGPFTEITKILP